MNNTSPGVRLAATRRPEYGRTRACCSGPAGSAVAQRSRLRTGRHDNIALGLRRVDDVCTARRQKVGEWPVTLSMNGHGPAELLVTPQPTPLGVALRLAGEMDIATARHLTEVVRALPVGLLRHVRLDLADLAFIDASGLTALVETSTLVRSHGGQLILSNPRPLLLRLLEVTQLAATFDEDTTIDPPYERGPSGRVT